jgi:hypothetical protein
LLVAENESRRLKDTKEWMTHTDDAGWLIFHASFTPAGDLNARRWEFSIKTNKAQKVGGAKVSSAQNQLIALKPCRKYIIAAMIMQILLFFYFEDCAVNWNPSNGNHLRAGKKSYIYADVKNQVARADCGFDQVQRSIALSASYALFSSFSFAIPRKKGQRACAHRYDKAAHSRLVKSTKRAKLRPRAATEEQEQASRIIIAYSCPPRRPRR